MTGETVNETKRVALPVLVAAALGALFLGLVLGRTLLSPAPGDEHAGHDHEAPADVEEWTCSMHPDVRSPEPGSCPICGMDLVPAGSVGSSDPAVLELSERAAALARVRTEPVRRLDQGGALLRLSGHVDYDESTRNTVTAWVSGRVDELSVRVTGERVRAGQVVAVVYSPEVYAAHSDLLAAVRQAAALGGGAAGADDGAGDGAAGATDRARRGAEATLQSARKRLELLGIPADEISAMESSDAARDRVRIRSPFSGTVIDRLVSEGEWVKTGQGLYRTARLSSLWAQLDAYEQDLPALRVGQEVELTSKARPGETTAGRIAFIDPQVDPKRRTARVRVALRNDGAWKPGMFVEAKVQTGGAADNPLTVPRTAPLFTGERSLVYVALPGDAPRYEARTVRLGPLLGDRYPVLGGLSQGERVVVRGAFLLDADLQIRGGAGMMSRAGDDPVAVTLSAAQTEALGRVLSAYLTAQEGLAADSLKAAKRGTADMLAAMKGFDPGADERIADHWTKAADHMEGPGKTLLDTGDIEEARAHFEHLSMAWIDLLEVFGNPLDEAVQVSHCPMAFDDRGASWVQREGVINNSYFGDYMLRCGSVESVVGKGQFLVQQPARAEPAASGHSGHGH